MLRVRGADRADLALLEDPEELRLERERHLRHLVEEERAAVGDLEEPFLVVGRAGEGAATVAEKLAFEQVLGDCSAVLGDEKLIAPFRTVVQRRGDELFADTRLTFDEHRHARFGDLVELRQERRHGLALPEDWARVGLPLLFAALQEGVLFVEAFLGRGQAVDEPRAGDRERRVGREHGQDFDVFLVQHRRRVAVVDLQDAEDVVPFPEGDADRAADGRAHERLALPDVARGVGGQHRCALADHFAKDAARERHGTRRGRALSSRRANARRHRHVRAAAVVDVAQDDGDVRRARHERENRVRHVRERFAEVRRRADLLLCAVEGREASRVFLDARRDTPEVLDLADGDDARVVRLVLDLDVDVRDRVARTELDHVAVFEHRLVPRALAERRARPAPDERRAVGRGEIFERRCRGPGVDARVLARHVPIVDHEVIARPSADSNHVPPRVERFSLARCRSDEKPKHRPRV